MAASLHRLLEDWRTSGHLCVTPVYGTATGLMSEEQLERLYQSAAGMCQLHP